MSKDAVQNNQEFSGWRAFLWPIHNHEMKKFIPLALIMCCILFNYTIFRNTKDTLMISSSGAGVITFLKLYCVTPAAIIFFILYAKLCNVLDAERVFYAVMIVFLSFFAIFALFLNPYLETIQASKETIQGLMQSYPALKGFIGIYANWVYSLFFIMSELWGSVMLSLLFWQFANQITRMSEAKRFYGLFVVVSNVALILCGNVVSFCSHGMKRFIPTGADSWKWTINTLIVISIGVGCIAMMLYRWMHTNVLVDSKYYDGAKEKKKKEKPGLIESIKIIFTSPELGLITMLVVCYGVTINLVEVQWKNQVGLFFHGDKSAMNAFMGQYTAWTGISVIVFALFLGSNVLRIFGWLAGALFTPLVVLSCGSFFFVIVCFNQSISTFFSSTVPINPAYMATIVGAIIVVLSKATKYSLFDPTKEMAYIPLDTEIRTKGKAAVDVVGGRLGKSGGAFVQSTLLMAIGTVNVLDIVGIAAAACILMCIVWIYVAKALNTRINKTSEAKSN